MGRVLEVIQSDSLRWIRTQTECFVNNRMSTYLTECSERCNNLSLSSTHTKNFYDSVWGTIEINEGEIFILDSPILQRLRQIKQLGLADLLYSSANHTRFSHTLGVLQTADVMTEQIKKELEKKDVVIDKEMRQIIRLAAIFHDVGHMFCSHASENYFQKNRKASLYEQIKESRDNFNHLGIKPSLSEMISILIVNSSAIRSLLTIIQNGLESIQFDQHSQDEIIEKICCMILGFPYSEKTIPYAQVISGQIDADKLDYLKRDSHSTGVPVAVDMSRIFQKLRVVETNKDYKMIALHEKTNNIFKIAIAPAAVNTIDQLVISRSMMFENIYHHQKTLTAEDMLRYAMYNLDKSTKGLLDNLSNILSLTDCMVINADAHKVIECSIDDYSIIDRKRMEKACNILKNISKRHLFKRCVAFTDSNLTKVIQKEMNKEFFSRIIAGEIIDEQEHFVENVILQVEILKRTLSNSKYCFHSQTDVRLLIAPDVSVTSLNSNIAIDTKSNKDRNMEFEADNWLQSRSSRKSQNYLVSYPEDRYLVYIATEIVLLREFGLLINDMMIYSEEDEKQINNIKATLDSNGYFNELSTLAPDNIIDSYIGSINDLVNKWKIYEIFDRSTGAGIKLDEAYLKSHLKQYIQFKQNNKEFSVFLREYTNMLGQMHLISKENITKALNTNFQKILKDEFCNKSELEVCNIGTVQDSSALIAYHMNIVNQCMGASWKTKSLESILKTAKAGQRIVFLEDAFCSGKQILSVFETYMGIPVEERQTDEEHVQELPPDMKAKLKECKLFFSFIFYEKDNEAFFYDSLCKLGLNHVHIIADDVFPIGFFKRDLNSDDKKEQDILKKYMEKAGQRLISLKAHNADGSRKPKWTDDRMKTCRLGYNNAQQLVAFSWNTPTYTMTPLWMGADEPDFKWIPLFPRINK